MTKDGSSTRCGVAALLGAPNCGKSTLLNRLVGAKVAIVTPKVQTTRVRIRGIAIDGPAQIVLVDTPGIFSPKRRLERAMVAAAWASVRDADVVVLLFDATRNEIDHDTRRIIDHLKSHEWQATLALNKIDLIRRDRLLRLAATFAEEGIFTATFMVSGLTGDGVGDLRRHLAARMPAGPWLYPEDQLSDMPQRLHAAEITREKLFLALHQELPYALTVETDSWTAFQDGSVRIDQTIYVQRESQRAICLGKGGRTIKLVRTAAQRELEAALGCPVHLFLQVKVSESWIENPERYRDWGLPFDA